MLQPLFAIPLEREFEGWITRMIEDYFLILRRRAYIIGVSSRIERIWPADQALGVKGKVVGLQMKRPKLKNVGVSNSYTPEHLYWELGTPPHQLGLLLKRPEIVYCLPTFVNRRYSREALEHCIFWRPPNEMHKKIWYDRNRKAKSPSEHQRMAIKDRWGYFIEKVLSCDFGLPLALAALYDYLNGLSDDLRQLAQRGLQTTISVLWVDLEVNPKTEEKS